MKRGSYLLDIYIACWQATQAERRLTPAICGTNTRLVVIIKLRLKLMRNAKTLKMFIARDEMAPELGY